MKKRLLFNAAFLLVAFLLIQDSLAQDYTRLSLPEGAKLRLGQGQLSGSLAFSPDGTPQIAVASSIGIWLYRTESTLLLTGHTEEVLSVAFSPDGRTLASGSGKMAQSDCGMRTLANPKRPLKGIRGDVLSVAFSPRWAHPGQWEWQDGSVRLWNVNTGQEKATLEGHTDGIYLSLRWRFRQMGALWPVVKVRV